MTLLLTFFVLLLSFSSFDDKVFWKLRVIFSGAMPSVNKIEEKDRDAFVLRGQIDPTTELEKGSEKPTLVEDRLDGSKKNKEPPDFRNRKVFLVSSEKVFWGKGAVVSLGGREILSTMASFLREMPESRLVIGENASGGRRDDNQVGLERAWAVVEYLTTQEGLDRKAFSISGSSTVATGSLRARETNDSDTKAERVLEIVLLERSIYN